jgi:tetratricopeptide (TPR) repeat protein
MGRSRGKRAMSTDEAITGEGQPVPVVPSSGDDPKPRPRRWRRMLVLVLALGGVGAWYAWRLQARTEPPTVDLDGADREVISAVTLARAEVLQSPRSAAAWGKLGKILAAHRYLEPARICFIEAERLEPDESHWPYYQGLTLAFSDNDAAIVHFQRAIQLPGAQPAIRFRLAETLATQGRLAEAEEQYRSLLNDAALAPRAQLGLGRLAYQLGDLAAARRMTELAADESATRKAAHTLLAEIAQFSNDPSTAASERAVVSKLPDDPEWADPLLAEINREKVGKDARLARALELSRQKRVEDAAVLFQDLVREYPDWDQGWLNYGRLLMDSRVYAAAEQAFRTVLQLSPDSVTGHFHLGVVLFQRDDCRAAAAHFREVVRLKPDHAMAYYNLGHCLKRLNDRAGALAAFREAVRIRPDMARAHTNLSELLADDGKKTEAAAELRLSLDLNPDDEAAKKLEARLGQEK